jgi:DNA primase
LKERGLTDETIKNFRIGFAPDNWSSALEHLKNAGFTEEQIEDAGLIKKSNTGSAARASGRFYDRFRARIMFPITDSVGRIVAFSGRIFTPAQAADQRKDVAKYINSPETDLYHKSNILYGYDRARHAIRKTNFAVLVEGQMDLVATHQAGYTNTVALSGTALTSEHLVLLGRMSKNLCIALDADEAGIASASKSARAALRAGFDVKIAALPEGNDPADMIARGDVDTWKKTIKESKHVVDFLLDHHRKKSKDERDFKLLVQREVLPYLHDIASEIDKAHFIQRVAAQLSVQEEAVRQELSKTGTVTIHEGVLPTNAAAVHEAPLRAEDELVLMYLWQTQVKDPFIDITAFKRQVEAVLTPLGFKALEERLSHNSEAAFRFEALYDTEDTMKAAIHELLERLSNTKLKKELEMISKELKRAEGAGEKDEIAKWERKYQELHQKLAQLPNHL